MENGFLPKLGNYKDLLSYQKSVMIYDCTRIFCERFLGKSHNLSPIHITFLHFLKTRSSEICANIMICLINQCNYLLDQQIKQQEETFLEKGGLRENMYKARISYRNKKMKHE